MACVSLRTHHGITSNTIGLPWTKKEKRGSEKVFKFIGSETMVRRAVSPKYGVERAGGEVRVAPE